MIWGKIAEGFLSRNNQPQFMVWIPDSPEDLRGQSWLKNVDASLGREQNYQLIDRLKFSPNRKKPISED